MKDYDFNSVIQHLDCSSLSLFLCIKKKIFCVNLTTTNCFWVKGYCSKTSKLYAFKYIITLYHVITITASI